MLNGGSFTVASDAIDVQMIIIGITTTEVARRPVQRYFSRHGHVLKRGAVAEIS